MATGGEALTSLEAVVLAAGAGARFGGGKLTASWRDGVLLDGALASAFAAPARTVTVVWGADARVAEAARAFAERTGQAGRLRLVQAARAAEGMAESLKAGLASLPADCVGAFVFLGDMPKVPAAIAADLARTLAGGALAAAPSCEGRRGHPVLFAAALFSTAGRPERRSRRGQRAGRPRRGSGAGPDRRTGRAVRRRSPAGPGLGSGLDERQAGGRLAGQHQEGVGQRRRNQRRAGLADAGADGGPTARYRSRRSAPR